MKNRLARFVATKLKATTAANLTDFTTVFGNGFDNATDVDNLKSYKNSLYLYIGVSMIAKRVAGIPLELYKIKNKKGDVVEIFDHPLLSLISNPNSFQSQREFWELSVTYYLLSGDCFWYLQREGRTIAQMIPLRPDQVEVILSADRRSILAYEFRAGTIQRFVPEDILHIRNIDPTDPLRGVGVVRPASSRILTEIEATKYQANFFRNQARPDIAVFAEADVSPEESDLYRRRWKTVFGGKAGGSVGFFGKGIKSIQELNKTPKEMDFIETQKFLRGDILAALHIPEEMVSGDGSNRATSKEAYKMYLQEAVLPVFEAFEDGINNRLVPQVDYTVFFGHTDPTPVDREAQLKEVVGLKDAGIISANEGRAYFNYEPVEGADTLAAKAPKLPAELIETAKGYIRRRPLLAKKLTAVDDLMAQLQLSTPKHTPKSVFPTKAMKAMFAKAVNDNIDRKAEKVKDALDDFHKGMLKRVLDTDLDVNAFMDVQKEKKTAKDIFTPLMIKLYQEGGQAALDALFKKSADHFFADAVLLAAIEGRVDFFTNSMVDTTYEVVKGKILDAVKEGHGIPKLSASIKDYFEEMTTKRAYTIAQTETNFVLSKSTNDAYSQSSVVIGKEWISVGDNNVRPEHEDNEAQGPIGKHEAFSNGEMYPAEHSVNCRCVLAPAV